MDKLLRTKILNTRELITNCKTYLTQKWLEIINNDEVVDFIKDLNLIKNIKDCLTSSTKSYHYVLPTQILCKIINFDLDCRSLQASYNKPGAFDARSVAHEVIVAFDRENHSVLGGSPEPYVNNPLRCDAVTKENRSSKKNRKDWDKLIEILDFIENSNDQNLTKKIFNQMLFEIYKLLESVIIIYPVPNRISLNQTIDLIRTYITEKSGGERIEAIITALFRIIAERFKIFDTIKREKVNVADSSSGMAADIECYYKDEVTLLVEVKDQKLTFTQVDTKLNTARSKRISEILFIAEKGIEVNEEKVIYNRMV